MYFNSPELLFLFLKGMTGALAPFSYLVPKSAPTLALFVNISLGCQDMWWTNTLAYFTGGEYYKLFTAVITSLVAYFFMILNELRR